MDLTLETKQLLYRTQWHDGLNKIFKSFITRGRFRISGASSFELLALKDVAQMSKLTSKMIPTVRNALPERRNRFNFGKLKAVVI